MIRSVIAGALALGWVIAAPPASASCVVFGDDAEMLAAAEVVFVGRVLATTNMDRWASVGVEEIWQGPELPERVEVIGGEGPGVGSSVDRHYENGIRYLFALDVRGGTLHDTACTMTRPWEADLVRLRPAAVRRPVPASPQEAETGARRAEPNLPLMTASGLLVVVGGIGLFGILRLARAGRKGS